MEPFSNCANLFLGSVIRLPFFGVGIRPLGPRTLAYLASLGMSAGVASRISKSSLPALILTMVFSEKTSIVCFLPVAWGKDISPLTPVSSVFM